MTTKIRAGRYTTTVKSGSYVVKNVKSKVWLVLNDRGRKVAQFETLAAANEWLDSLETRPASDKSKKYLRDLLAQHEGTELANKIKSKLNTDYVFKGQPVPQALVSLAIKQLTSPVAWSQVPAQPSMTRGEAIASARNAIAASQGR